MYRADFVTFFFVSLSCINICWNGDINHHFRTSFFLFLLLHYFNAESRLLEERVRTPFFPSSSFAIQKSRFGWSGEFHFIHQEIYRKKNFTSKKKKVGKNIIDTILNAPYFGD